ncbi:hypothetical protein U1Q18_048129 [Sarracenia purpurea var. burkii]
METKKLEPDENEPIQKLNVPEKRRCHSEILPRSDDVTHKAFDAMPTSKSVANLGEEVEEPEEGTNLAVDGEEIAEESQENRGMIEPQVCSDLGRLECVVDIKSVAGLDPLRMVGTGMKQLGEIMQSSSSVPQVFEEMSQPLPVADDALEREGSVLGIEDTDVMTVPGGNWHTQLQSGVFETPAHHASAASAPRPKSWASVLNSECSGTMLDYYDLSDNNFVVIEDNLVDDQSWRNYAVGYFLGSDMAFGLSAGYGLQQPSAWGHNSCAGGANDMCGAESYVDTIPAMFGKDNARGSVCARQLPVSWAKIVGKRKEKGEKVIKVAAKRAIPRPVEQNRGPGQPRCSSMNPALHHHSVSGVSPSKSGVLAACLNQPLCQADLASKFNQAVEGSGWPS